MKYLALFARIIVPVISIFILVDTQAKADEAQVSCQFEPPTHMLHRLAQKYEGFQGLDVIDYHGYTTFLSLTDRKRFKNCELRFSKTQKFLSLDSKLQSELIENYNNAYNVGIRGGDYQKNNFIMFSSCQLHVCVDNIHSDVFDKNGNMVGVILYQYPSEPSGSAAGQAIADILKEKHPINYYPLEAWTFISKGHDTPELRQFLKEALDNFQKSSKTTILAVHDLSD